MSDKQSIDKGFSPSSVENSREVSGGYQPPRSGGYQPQKPSTPIRDNPGNKPPPQKP